MGKGALDYEKWENNKLEKRHQRNLKLKSFGNRMVNGVWRADQAITGFVKKADKKRMKLEYKMSNFSLKGKVNELKDGVKESYNDFKDYRAELKEEEKEAMKAAKEKTEAQKKEKGNLKKIVEDIKFNKKEKKRAKLQNKLAKHEGIDAEFEAETKEVYNPVKEFFNKLYDEEAYNAFPELNVNIDLQLAGVTLDEEETKAVSLPGKPEQFIGEANLVMEA